MFQCSPQSAGFRLEWDNPLSNKPTKTHPRLASCLISMATLNALQDFLRVSQKVSEQPCNPVTNPCHTCVLHGTRKMRMFPEPPPPSPIGSWFKMATPAKKVEQIARNRRKSAGNGSAKKWKATRVHPNSLVRSTRRSNKNNSNTRAHTHMSAFCFTICSEPGNGSPKDLDHGGLVAPQNLYKICRHMPTALFCFP